MIGLERVEALRAMTGLRRPDLYQILFLKHSEIKVSF